MDTPTKVGQLAGPNARAKVRVREGFAIEMRLRGKRTYLPIDGPGDYQAGVEDLGFAPPSNAFPVEFFEVEVKQALLNMLFYKNGIAVLRDAWSHLCKALPDEPHEKLREVIRTFAGKAMSNEGSEIGNEEFRERQSEAIEFVLDNFIAETKVNP